MFIYWNLQKQFKLQAQTNQEPKQVKKATPTGISPPANQMKDNPSDSLGLIPNYQSQHNPDPLTAGQNRKSVHERIRVPVTYDDLLGEDDHKDELPRPE